MDFEGSRREDLSEDQAMHHVDHEMVCCLQRLLLPSLESPVLFLDLLLSMPLKSPVPFRRGLGEARDRLLGCISWRRCSMRREVGLSGLELMSGVLGGERFGAHGGPKAGRWRRTAQAPPGKSVGVLDCMWMHDIGGLSCAPSSK